MHLVSFQQWLLLFFTTLILFYLAFFWGELIIQKIHQQIKSTFFPIIGFSILIIIFSLIFFLFNNNQITIIFFGLILIITMMIDIKFNLHKTARIKQFIHQLLCFLTSFFLVISLYFFHFGINFGIMGYETSDDTMVHAVIARNCSANVNLIEKFKRKSLLKPCMDDYPFGAHAIINLLSNISGIETSYLVIYTSLIFHSLLPFILISIIKTNKAKKKLHWWYAVIATLTYFPLAILLHGYLPQVSYVPLLLTFIWLLFEKKSAVLLSLVLGAILFIYGFVALFSIGIIILIYIINAIFLALTQKTAWKKDLKLLITILIVGSLLAFPSAINTYRIVGEMMVDFITPNKEPNVRQSKGNLINDINPLIGSGIWFEKDYRYQKAPGLQKIYLLFALIIALLAIDYWVRDKQNKNLQKILFTLIVIHLLNKISINTAYTLTKTYSLLAPFIALGALLKIDTLKISYDNQYLLKIIYIICIIYSNWLLIAHINYLPEQAFIRMKEISQLIGNDKALIFSINDWLSYYVDNKQIDINGLHYFPDIKPTSLNYKYIIIEGQQMPKIIQCNQISLDPFFSVCEL